MIYGHHINRNYAARLLSRRFSRTRSVTLRPVQPQNAATLSPLSLRGVQLLVSPLKKVFLPYLSVRRPRPLRQPFFTSVLVTRTQHGNVRANGKTEAARECHFLAWADLSAQQFPFASAGRALRNAFFAFAVATVAGQ